VNNSGKRTRFVTIDILIYICYFILMSEYLSSSGDGPIPRRDLLNGPDVRQDGVMIDFFECGESFSYIELQVSFLADMKTLSTWFPRSVVTSWGNGDFAEGVAAARNAAYTAPLELIESGFIGLPSQLEP
jgi:hypothetical protein